MAIRDLQPTDIRCELCDAAPGEPCRNVGPDTSRVHAVRVFDQIDLASQGWQWQEVDQRDEGARRSA
jgi:hypothetical protein